MYSIIHAATIRLSMLESNPTMRAALVGVGGTLAEGDEALGEGAAGWEGREVTVFWETVGVAAGLLSGADGGTETVICENVLEEDWLVMGTVAKGRAEF